ncbi:MAG TPA: histidine--tRNA ligase [Candidatus Acidoferrum sp.]
MSDREQEKAAKRAQWEEINRAKAAAKQKEQEAPAKAESRPASPQKQFQAIRGTRDLLPPDTALWTHVEQTAHDVFNTFGFGEIRPPIFEPTELFARAVGGETDIVSKEMYTFEDRAAGLPDPSDMSPTDYVAAIKSAIDAGQLHNDPALLAQLEFQLENYNLRKDAEKAHLIWMYFVRGLRFGDSISLRPEATASVCRAYIEHGMQQLPQPVKLYYMGPMFRRERPQKGRYRQFYQIGAEVLGGSDAPAIDAEAIEMVMTFFDRLELTGVELDINSIGHAADNCRRGYVEKLRAALESVKDKLGEDSRRRIETNPLRVLDSKLEHEQAIIATLPRIADHLCDECKTHYAAVKHQLELRGVIYRENWRLVRGLDYYMRTTFEITAKGLGSQNAVCGGGRYDGLVELLGGPPTKGIGFAIGEDRLILSLQESGKGAAAQGRDVYIAYMGERAYATAIRAAKDLRTAGFSVELPPTELKFGKSLERADKLGSRYALILGDNEVSEGSWTLKTLADGSQQKFTEPELLEFLCNTRNSSS